MTKPDPLPASAHANRPYGSGMRGIQLFFSSPLVASPAGLSRTPEEDINEMGQVVGRRVLDVSAIPTRSIAPARSAP